MADSAPVGQSAASPTGDDTAGPTHGHVATNIIYDQAPVGQSTASPAGDDTAGPAGSRVNLDKMSHLAPRTGEVMLYEDEIGFSSRVHITRAGCYFLM